MEVIAEVLTPEDAKNYREVRLTLIELGLTNRVTTHLEFHEKRFYQFYNISDYLLFMIYCYWPTRW